MTFAIGDPAHINLGHNELLALIQEQADRFMVTVTLPDVAGLGDTGHVDDHNLIVAALQAIADAPAETAPPTVTEGSSTNATFATLTNPDGDGKNYRKATWTASGQLVLTEPGWVEVLVVGAGGPYTNPYATGGTGGSVERGWRYLAAGTHTVTVGAATTGSSYTRSGFSALGAIKAMGGVNAAGANDGAGDGAYGEITSTISGSSQKYAGGPAANTNNTTTYGSGGVYSGGVNPENGVVIVRYLI